MSIVDTAKDVYDLLAKGAKVELQERLMRLREEALSLQEENLALRQKVRELEQAVEVSCSMTFDGRVYWQVLKEHDKDGPFCQRCFDSDKKMIRLQKTSGGRPNRQSIPIWRCCDCKTQYARQT